MRRMIGKKMALGLETNGPPKPVGSKEGNCASKGNCGGRRPYRQQGIPSVPERDDKKVGSWGKEAMLIVFIEGLGRMCRAGTKRRPTKTAHALDSELKRVPDSKDRSGNGIHKTADSSSKTQYSEPVAEGGL